MKLVSNSHLYDGVLAQTPTYARAEKTKYAHFVAIATTDADMNPDRIAKIHKAADITTRSAGINTVAYVIDARPKQSGSELKATKAERDELHDRPDSPAA